MDGEGEPHSSSFCSCLSDSASFFSSFPRPERTVTCFPVKPLSDWGISKNGSAVPCGFPSVFCFSTSSLSFEEESDETVPIFPPADFKALLSSIASSASVDAVTTDAVAGVDTDTDCLSVGGSTRMISSSSSSATKKGCDNNCAAEGRTYFPLPLESFLPKHNKINSLASRFLIRFKLRGCSPLETFL